MAKRPTAKAAPPALPATPAKISPGAPAGLLLFAAVLAAYLPVLNGGLLWDDSAHVTRPELQSFHGLWRIWSDLWATQQYYPVLHTAFWMEHRLWGDAVIGYHLVNLALHASAALLLLIILRRLEIPGAWLAAFIFALHPVCVESVAWITEQKNTLSAVFYLASALVYLNFDQTRRRSSYLLALGLFVLALLSKTVTATLPAALLVVFWWRRGKLSWKRDALPLAPWFALGAVAGLFTAWVEREVIGAKGSDFTLTLLDRFLVAGRVIWFYLAKLLFPVNLIFIYPRWSIDSTAAWQYLFPLGALALGAALWLLRNRSRGPLAGFLFFAGTLFPVLGFFDIFPFRYSYAADHFQYLASLGIIVPVASGLTIAARRIPSAPALAAALIATLGALTWSQSGIYRDAETLYKETIARNPECWMAHHNLAIQLALLPGRLPEAVAEFQATLRIKPDHPEAHRNLGLALSRMRGRIPEAVAEYQAALRRDPNDPDARLNLGSLLSRVPGRGAEAAANLQAALRLKPDSAEAHYALGNVFAQGQPAAAIAEYQAALRIRADYAEAHVNLGNLLTTVPNRKADAIAEYEAALRLQPDYLEAHFNLGTVLMDIPARRADAIAHLEAALRIQPNLTDAHINLGAALSDVPARRAEAISHLEAALAQRPDDAPARALLRRLQLPQR